MRKRNRKIQTLFRAKGFDAGEEKRPSAMALHLDKSKCDVDLNLVRELWCKTIEFRRVCCSNVSWSIIKMTQKIQAVLQEAFRWQVWTINSTFCCYWKIKSERIQFEVLYKVSNSVIVKMQYQMSIEVQMWSWKKVYHITSGLKMLKMTFGTFFWLKLFSIGLGPRCSW